MAEDDRRWKEFTGSRSEPRVSKRPVRSGKLTRMAISDRACKSNGNGDRVLCWGPDGFRFCCGVARIL